MNLFLLGLNHKSAPIDIREQLAFPDDAIPAALESLRDQFGFKEALILSTCNRVEVVANESLNGRTSDHLKEFLSDFHTVESTRLDSHLYVYGDNDLIRHIFRVASSLDSMVPGESQILGQLKQAYSRAQESGVAGRSLRRLLPHAFFVAKRVRNETKIANSAVSVSSVAVELALKIFGDLEGRVVLLIGAGKMSELAAESLLKAGASKVQVTNRTLSKGRGVASRFGCEVLPFDDLENSLATSDIVLVSTGATSHILSSPLMETVIRKRKYTPLFVIDISVPRNVHPSVNEIDNIFLYDIDDLQSVVSGNMEERQKEAALAEQIVHQEVQNFRRISQRQMVGPLVSSVRQRLEEICLEELQKEGDGLDQDEYQKIEKMLRRTAHRIAHPLMIQIKKIHDDPNRQYHNIEMIKEAFDLDEQK